MKKRILSIILAVAVIACMIPLGSTFSFAKDEKAAGFYWKSECTGENQYELSLYLYSPDISVGSYSVYYNFTDALSKGATVELLSDTSDYVTTKNYVPAMKFVVANYSGDTALPCNKDVFIMKVCVTNVTKAFTLSKQANSARTPTYVKNSKGEDVTSSFTVNGFELQLAPAPGTFADLQQLIYDAENGGTIKLTKNYIWGKDDGDPLMIQNRDSTGKTLTIDMNGHKISGDSDCSCIAVDRWIEEGTTSKLTLIDNSESGGGTICSGGSGVYVNESGTLIAKNIKFTGNETGVYNSECCMIIENCEFTGNSIGISNYWTMAVTDTTVTGNEYGIVNNGDDLYIGGSTKVTDNEEANIYLEKNTYKYTGESAWADEFCDLAPFTLGDGTTQIEALGNYVVKAPSNDFKAGITTWERESSTPMFYDDEFNMDWYPDWDKTETVKDEACAGAFTTNGTADDVKYFFADDPTQYVKFDTDKLVLDTIPSGSYKITVNSGDHGVVYADKQFATSGEKVTLNVVPDNGYQLKSLKYNDGEDHDITSAKSFTMPLANVIITAEFEEAESGPKLVPDFNNDGKIDNSDIGQLSSDDVCFTVWPNNDDDAEGKDGVVEDDKDCADGMVDGSDDLRDFFPVLVDVSEVDNWDGLTWKLKTSGTATVNVVFTLLSANNVAVSDMEAATALDGGTPLYEADISSLDDELQLPDGFLKKGKGIFLFEGCELGEGNIVLTGYSNAESAASFALPIQVGYAITDGTAQDANGSIKIDKTFAAKGETVTVTVSPATGYALKSLKYNDGDEDYEITEGDNGYQFTMPECDVTVTAEFEEVPAHTHKASENYMANASAHWFACSGDDCSLNGKTDAETLANYEAAFADKDTGEALKTTLGYTAHSGMGDFKCDVCNYEDVAGAIESIKTELGVAKSRAICDEARAAFDTAIENVGKATTLEGVNNARQTGIDNAVKADMLFFQSVTEAKAKLGKAKSDAKSDEAKAEIDEALANLEKATSLKAVEDEMISGLKKAGETEDKFNRIVKDAKAQLEEVKRNSKSDEAKAEIDAALANLEKATNIKAVDDEMISGLKKAGETEDKFVKAIEAAKAKLEKAKSDAKSDEAKAECDTAIANLDKATNLKAVEDEIALGLKKAEEQDVNFNNAMAKYKAILGDAKSKAKSDEAKAIIDAAIANVEKATNLNTITGETVLCLKNVEKAEAEFTKAVEEAKAKLEKAKSDAKSDEAKAEIDTALANLEKATSLKAVDDEMISGLKKAEEAETAFEKAVKDAKDALDSENSKDPLNDESSLTAGKENIEKATSLKAVSEAKLTAVGNIQKAQAQELAKAKEAAKAAIDEANAKNPIDEKVLAEIKNNIDNSKTKTEVVTMKDKGVKTINDENSDSLSFFEKVISWFQNAFEICYSFIMVIIEEIFNINI